MSGLKHPFESKDVFSMIAAISDNQYHPVSPSMSEFSQKLIGMMLNKNP
jgi:hypothetical protein